MLLTRLYDLAIFVGQFVRWMFRLLENRLRRAAQAHAFRRSDSRADDQNRIGNHRVQHLVFGDGRFQKTKFGCR